MNKTLAAIALVGALAAGNAKSSDLTELTDYVRANGIPSQAQGSTVYTYEKGNDKIEVSDKYVILKRFGPTESMFIYDFELDGHPDVISIIPGKPGKLDEKLVDNIDALDQNDCNLENQVLSASAERNTIENQFKELPSPIYSRRTVRNMGGKIKSYDLVSGRCEYVGKASELDAIQTAIVEDMLKGVRK